MMSAVHGAGKRPENEEREIDWKIALKRGRRKKPGRDGAEGPRRGARLPCGPRSNTRSGGEALLQVF